MKITAGGRSWGGSLGEELAGIGLMVFAVNLLLPMNISVGVQFLWALLTGLLLFLGI